MPGSSAFPLNEALFRPGMRVALAVSGGADSVALLLAMVELAPALGVVLSVAHVNHGLRGADADSDEAFVRDLAAAHNLEFFLHRCDTRASAAENKEGIEEAARNLRYGFFRALVAAGKVDAVATAHTLNDQAETVLLKLLRGAWTEGLGGIHPIYEIPGGRILRPMLGAQRSEIESYLVKNDQKWHLDDTNFDTIYTRNRVRNQLLPILTTYNPSIFNQLASLSSLARDEEDYWQKELAKLLPSLFFPGRPVRGGGRASSTLPGAASLSIEVERLRSLHPALRRRVLRAALVQLNQPVSFDAIEDLLALCGFSGTATSPKRLDLSGGIRAERTPRELRLQRLPEAPEMPPKYSLLVPGEAVASDFGLIFRAFCKVDSGYPPATIRTPQSGDRVRLRHAGGAKRLKEVFERMRVGGPEREAWPLVEWQGELVWMQGVELESQVAVLAGLEITATPLSDLPAK
jgi:tRNA(Ile)-lysidine synthase